VPIEAVVFDIGGVLEITPATGWERRWAGELGLRGEDFARRLGPLWRPGELGHDSLQAIEDQTAEEFGLDRGQLSRLTADIWAEYLGTLNRVLADYFAALRPRFRTGMLSNSLVGAREREHAAYGLGDMCDVIVYSDEEDVAKPDPRIYELACARLRCAPGRAVFVDDRQPCVDGARAAGLQAIRFRDNNQTIAALDAVLGVAAPAAPRAGRLTDRDPPG
jgi:putative hydrolase of the HAD superfamily